MGFRFRKTVKMGPVNLNFSKSGIGTSIGGKGFRVGVNSKGKSYTSASIPGTGISYTSYGKSSPKNKSYVTPSLHYTTLGKQFYNPNNLSSTYFELPVEYTQMTGQNGCLSTVLFLGAIVLCFTITPIGLIALVGFFFYQYRIAKIPQNVRNNTLKQAQKSFANYKYIDVIAKLLPVNFTNPDDFAICHLIGLSNYNLGKYKDAIEYLETAHRSNTSDLRTLFFIGNSHYLLKTEDDINKSILNFEKFLEIDPKNEHVKFCIAKNLFDVKEYESAIFYLQGINESSSNYLKSINTIAACFFESAQYELAIESLKKAPLLKRNLDEDLKVTHYMLGKTYDKLGDKQSAIKHLNRIYAQDISYEDVSERIKSLNA